ncbi:hypothetical protein D0860_08630 [Hortaea werneckii]|uniref:Uncharacterized protein n=1 Tax=Hortaea werneckii TaxID=91943 RepID=A0A3M7G8U1_HORWE|nr:hypothetical protein D0860_08630 [Hortaea werneckii]
MDCSNLPNVGIIGINTDLNIVGIRYPPATILTRKISLRTFLSIFLVFSLLTVAIGFLGIAFLVDFPDRAGFINSKEIKFIIRRINKDRSDASEEE